MKKQNLKLSLIGGMLLAMSASVNAQWTENATAVYLNSTTKNVGIGTTTPAFALDLIRSGSANLSLKSTTGTSNLLLDRANSTATSSVSYRTNGVGTWQTGTVGTDNFAIRNISSGNTAFTVLAANNNVGIGTTAPIAKLEVRGAAGIRVSSTVTGNGTADWIAGSFGGNDSDRVVMGSLYGVATLGAHNKAHTAWANLAINQDGGSVAIGTKKFATGYKLSVNGSIMCTALRVQDFASWPDYVFANDYDLKSLSEVEDYINTNKRLPGMPSDCEVMENGIDVGQMQAKVVEKVEENTLYIIQLSKENQELKAQLKAIQAQLNAMQK
jgi:hypothetical protein